MTTPFPLDLARCDIRQISAALDQGVVTSVDLVLQYTARILRDNHDGRCLRAVMQLSPRELVLARAEALDKSRKTGKIGPLHGIPVLIQDSFATEPGFKLDTTAGSPALLTSRPRSNAAVIEQLLNAGAILLGKTNLTFMHNWYHPGTPSGWSRLGGQVVSAFGPDLPVRGSSVGNAVAVSAGWCAAAIGSESCGGVTTPAGLAGVYALKPSPGRIDSGGLVPCCAHILVVGCMGRSARDVALQVDVLSEGQTSLVSALESGSVPKIGIVSMKHCRASSEEEAMFAKAVTAWPETVVQDVWLEHFDAMLENEDHLTTYRAGCREAWTQYLAETDGPSDSVGDVIAWHNQHPRVSFADGQSGQDRLCEALDYSPSQGDIVDQARENMDRVATSFIQVLDALELDVLIWPDSKFVSAAGGFPSCTVPIGVKQNGCPYGVSAVAMRDREDSLVHFIAVADKAFGPRPVPQGF